MTGCTHVSDACEHCYAERIAGRHLPVTRCPACGGTGNKPMVNDAGYAGFTHCFACDATGNVGFTPTFHPDRLDVPLHWRKPRRIFVCSMSDLFHEEFTDEQIAKVFGMMALNRQHTYMVLTKRPSRMREWVAKCGDHGDRGWVTHNRELPGSLARDYADGGIIVGYRDWPLPNVWLGVTVENQQRADERIPILLDTPAAVRFVSVEPMLGPVEVGEYLPWHPEEGQRGLDWVICGGETGPGARPMQPEWALDVYRQCKAAGVPFFFKQWGKWKVTAPPVIWSHMHEMEATRDFPAVSP